MLGDITMRVGCEFKAEVFNKNNDVVFETGTFHNTVLKAGLLQWFTYNLTTMTTYINIGTGSSTPADTQTQLDNRLYSTNTLFVAATLEHEILPPTMWAGIKKVFQFNIGTCTGDFSELGLSRTANANYFNRQLFKDANNQEIIVRVAADEGLRITCLIKVYPDPSINQYGRIFKLDLKGATSGSIIFSNGTTGVSRTVAQLTTYSTSAGSTTNITELSTLFGDALRTFIPLKQSPIDQCVYLMTYSEVDVPGFCITTNTLVGNSAPPQLISVQALQSSPTNTVSLQDITAGTNVSINYLKNIDHSLLNYTYYGFGTLHNNIYDFIWGTTYLYATTNTENVFATSHSIISSPTVDNLTIVRDCYFAPGRLTSTNATIKRLTLTKWASVAEGAIYTFDFPTPITINSQEEITFRYSITLAGYTP